MKKILNLIKRYNIVNIYSYFIGNYRYKLYYSKYKFLIRKHILEQIEYRINSMDQECYNNGQCKICGCKTTALQMANKACDKPCYPKMMNFLDQKFAKTGEEFYCQATKRWWKLDKRWNKFRDLSIINKKLYNRYGLCGKIKI